MMLTHFGLACEMPAVGNDLDTADGGPPPPCYLIPWFFKTHPPRSLSNNWPLRANARQVGEGNAIYVFPQNRDDRLAKSI